MVCTSRKECQHVAERDATIKHYRNTHLSQRLELRQGAQVVGIVTHRLFTATHVPNEQTVCAQAPEGISQHREKPGSVRDMRIAGKLYCLCSDKVLYSTNLAKAAHVCSASMVYTTRRLIYVLL